MRSYYPVVVKILRTHGFEHLRHGKGDHEIWSNGKDSVTVNYNLSKRHTANVILKLAGIDEKV
jgi:predicted RNA binding protein YcfA (HicA-like mRNA interferase family)